MRLSVDASERNLTCERVSAIEGHIDMADFDRKMFINSGMMSEERAQKNYDNVVAMYSKELAEVKEAMSV